jgi:hypothetical protein
MNCEKKTSILHENLFTVMTIPPQNHFRMRIFPNKLVQKKGTHSLYSINLPRNSCLLYDNVPKGSAENRLLTAI